MDATAAQARLRDDEAAAAVAEEMVGRDADVGVADVPVRASLHVLATLRLVLEMLEADADCAAANSDGEGEKKKTKKLLREPLRTISTPGVSLGTMNIEARCHAFRTPGVS